MKTHEIFIPNFGPSPGLCQRRATSPGNGPVSHLYLEGHPTSRKEGIEIESVKNRGYKILSGDLLIPQVIEDLCPLTVSYNPQCQSTQLDAKTAMEAGANPLPFIWLLFKQLVRGVLGATTSVPSQRGSTCPSTSSPTCLSIKLLPIPLMVAAAIYKALKNLALLDVDIKWVNDIYYKGKKSEAF